MKTGIKFLAGVAFIAAHLVPLAAAARTAVPAPPVAVNTPPAPKLIVVISVDQFSADLFAEYRGQVSGGLKRLQQGVVFPSGYQSHAATETCPGHSTILTGVHPSRSGIIANNWSDPASTRTDKDGKPDYSIYCAEDETLPGHQFEQLHRVVRSSKSADTGRPFESCVTRQPRGFHRRQRPRCCHDGRACYRSGLVVGR